MLQIINQYVIENGDFNIPDIFTYKSSSAAS